MLYYRQSHFPISSSSFPYLIETIRTRILFSGDRHLGTEKDGFVTELQFAFVYNTIFVLRASDGTARLFVHVPLNFHKKSQKLDQSFKLATHFFFIFKTQSPRHLMHYHNTTSLSLPVCVSSC